MQCRWLKIILVESFSFLQEFKIPFELRFTTFSQKKMPKNPEKQIILTTTKIGYFAQFGIFADISGSSKSQISLLIYFLFSYRNKNNAIVQAHTCAKAKL